MRVYRDMQRRMMLKGAVRCQKFVRIRLLPSLIVTCCLFVSAVAENGYDLWLRYGVIEDESLLVRYRNTIKSCYVEGESATLDIVRDELKRGLEGLLDTKVDLTDRENASLLLGVYHPNSQLAELLSPNEVEGLSDEGFAIVSKRIGSRESVVITAFHDVALLYGTFHFLRLLQSHQDISNLNFKSVPKIKFRFLNHWDNLDRTVERGYAGFSIWNWHQLPEVIDQRYIDYARANASIGINSIVLTNVNTNSIVLRDDYLKKVKALADLFRPYGIKTFLTARFSAPMELDDFETADPRNRSVRKWWQNKAEKIYELIPDFGGFLVKANSEGQPGPLDYNRTHAAGANMLADAVAPYGGLVLWRTFVYSDAVFEDRHMQAYDEFVPLDGKFKKNVILQVKNGAIDFQPREPFHPLFGAMKKTGIAPEFQITQEYVGQGTHLVYLGTYFKEILDADTYADGENSTVGRIADGTISQNKSTAVAGVSNIGNDINWTSHPFAQANWYAFGRLAWNHELTARDIAEEWIRMTWTNEEAAVATIMEMMMSSHEAAVNYMTPLGLHHIMDAGHHYGPGPWVDKMPRADWKSTYYHKADGTGIGFDRTRSGSNAIGQYRKPLRDIFYDIEECPERYLLFFHHIPWNKVIKSGKTLWDHLCLKYQVGNIQVQQLINQWQSVRSEIDHERFRHVMDLLSIQKKEAAWWRDACISYFQTFSNKPIPQGVPQPQYPLEYYQNLTFPYAPGH